MLLNNANTKLIGRDSIHNVLHVGRWFIKRALPPFENSCFSSCWVTCHHPLHGHRKRGRLFTTFVDALKRDLVANSKFELESCMRNREDWRARRTAQLRPT